MTTLSIIVPFHKNLAHLTRCLAGVRAAWAGMDGHGSLADLIVVADGPTDNCSALVSQAGGRLVTLPTQSGPAVARNRGAADARGSVLVFIDADVVVAADVLGQILSVFDREPDLAAVFGAYDEEPEDQGFMSQGRNLSHSFVHQRSRPKASTFWAGLGAVRTDAFRAVGGFDERFGRPSVEDIELGYRFRAAGYPIALNHTLRGKHLKTWSFRSGLRTDLFDRGIPWVQLLHRYKSMQDDLNLSHVDRACTVVSYLALLFTVGAFWRPFLLWLACACLVTLVRLEWPYYAWFARRRGLLFALRWYPVHVFQHFLNGISFLIGSTLFVLSRASGGRWPGALPAETWQGRGTILE